MRCESSLGRERKGSVLLFGAFTLTGLSVLRLDFIFGAERLLEASPLLPTMLGEVGLLSSAGVPGNVPGAVAMPDRAEGGPTVSSTACLSSTTTIRPDHYLPTSSSSLV